jgi:hypothetical protein
MQQKGFSVALRLWLLVSWLPVEGGQDPEGFCDPLLVSELSKHRQLMLPNQSLHFQ